ncbi:class I SAM-dependent methyltransferase [Candidatus Halobonum tyrrellensis]|uniref:Type 11 methyltransferase n=1 Tax=Candidatus Halobonum tyrrellensis G22 TaxID=1324957 RepID=V4IYD4_9EURY|nr:methyltransferase domain-containing protein [Candidatus Halobonum tyrrellensis]ESP88157.1 type 11 methyltransferase [Candidatus Halobonum tyrrellensis G22]
MRRFSADYLDRTRRGMWESRDALEPLSLADRRRVLDVGCGTGELTRVLAEELETPEAGASAPDARVVGVDADTDLLGVARRVGADREPTGRTADYCAADALRLPFPDDAFDLVACQALLVNLPEPAAALREFARVSSELVATIEPDNADVGVSSTVDRESELEARLRRAYIDGVGTDVALGDRLANLFADAGLSDTERRRYHHEKRVEPPYSETDLEAAARKASGAGVADHEAELRRALPAGEYDALRGEWRAMGRDAVEQIRREEYRRVELVPFDVVVGRVDAPASGSGA